MSSVELDQLPDAVLVVDAVGCLVAANAAAAELLGPLDDMIGLDVAAHLGLVIEPTSVGRQISLHRRDSADVVEVVVTARATPDDGVVVCLRAAADNAGIAVVSTVAHELRSPLTSVKGYVSLMLNRWDRIEDDRKREMLAQVNSDADRVTRLITELLDISRLEAGRLILRRQSVDLEVLATSVVDKVTLAYPGLACVIDFDEVPEVYVDPDKVEQVLTNLVENAAKYASLTEMRISGVPTTGDDGRRFVSVSVDDTGEGIPADDIPKVFTRFFRRDHGRPTGTGLGLWISRGLVEAHDGTLVATSQVGVGSTFTFTLPIGAFEDVHG